MAMPAEEKPSENEHLLANLPKNLEELLAALSEQIASQKAELSEQIASQIAELSEQFTKQIDRTNRRMDQLDLSNSIVRSDLRRNFGLPSEKAIQHKGEPDDAVIPGHVPRINRNKIAGPHFP